MNVDNLENKKFFVREPVFTIIKATKMIDRSIFCAINDGDEITIIMEQWAKNVDLYAKDIIDTDRDWRMITFDMELGFELVGFISKIATALANENISIFVVSGYSTDHILVKEDKLEKTIEVLQKLGYTKVKPRV